MLQLVLMSEGNLTPRFGSGKISYVPIDQIKVLSQVRQIFSPAEIDDLSRSMTRQPDGSYRLINPLSLAMFSSPEEAEKYVNDINELWGANHSPVDLVFGDDGSCYILTAGERRFRAIGQKIGEIGVSSALVAATIEVNPSITETFPRQFLENNARVNVPPADEAAAIRRYIEFIRNRQPEVTNEIIAKKFGISKSKLYDALTFTSYPDKLQQQVDEFSYSDIVRAKPVFEVAQKFYEDLSAEPGSDEFSHIGEDVRLALQVDGVENLAAEEVISWLIMVQAERLHRRAGAGHRSTKPHDYAEKLNGEMRTASLFDTFDSVTRSLPNIEVPSPNSPAARREVALNGLLAAAHRALALVNQFSVDEQSKAV